MFKNNKYASPKVAMQQRDGLAILAFFLKVSQLLVLTSLFANFF